MELVLASSSHSGERDSCRCRRGAYRDRIVSGYVGIMLKVTLRDVALLGVAPPIKLSQRSGLGAGE